MTRLKEITNKLYYLSPVEEAEISELITTPYGNQQSIQGTLKQRYHQVKKLLPLVQSIFVLVCWLISSRTLNFMVTFLVKKTLATPEQALEACLDDRASITAILNDFDLSHYFGEIQTDDLANLFLKESSND